MADIYVKSNFPIITAITQATPAQVTTEAAHGLTTGDLIGISGVGGMSQVNNLKFTVTVVSTTAFTLDGIDSSAYTAFSGSGYVHKGPGSGTYRGPWLASTAFVAGDRVISNSVTSYRMHECTTGGTSGATQPTFSTTTNGTTADGTVTWTTRLPTSWANATLTLSRAGANDAAGDRIFLAQDHYESVPGSVSYGIASSVSIWCVNDTSGTPPTVGATTARLATTGTSTITLVPSVNPGWVGNYYGVIFQVGTGAGLGSLNLAGDNSGSQRLRLKDCRIEITATGAGAAVNGQASSDQLGLIQLENVVIKFGGTGQYINSARPLITWDGGGLDPAGAAITLLVNRITNSNAANYLQFSGLDLSSMSTSGNIFGSGDNGFSMIRDCRLPTGWTGDVFSGTPGGYSRISMHNCDSSNTNYRIRVKEFAGTLDQDTTIVRTDGASNGTTPLSWRVISNGNASYILTQFRTPEIVRWNETTGSAITVTVETLTDNVTLTDAECWLEMMYLSETGAPLGTWISDSKASPIAAATNQTTSSAAWTTTGIVTPVKQKLEVTFTPRMKGFVHARVAVGRASTTIYVDPKLTIS